MFQFLNPELRVIVFAWLQEFEGGLENGENKFSWLHCLACLHRWHADTLFCMCLHFQFCESLSYALDFDFKYKRPFSNWLIFGMGRRPFSSCLILGMVVFFGLFVALVTRQVSNYRLSLIRWLISFVEISSSHWVDGLVLLSINWFDCAADCLLKTSFGLLCFSVCDRSASSFCSLASVLSRPLWLSFPVLSRPSF